MNNYLFSQNLLVVMSLLCGIFCCIALKRLHKTHGTKKLLALTVYSGLVLFVEILFCARLFGLNNIPVSSYVIIYVCDYILIAIIVSLSRNKSLLLVAIPAFISSLTLLALTTNDFYQYFPNIESIFVQNYIKAHDVSSMSETHTKQQYNVTSLEQEVFGGEQSKGSVMAVKIPGEVSSFNTRNGYIYLPPAYNDNISSKIKFPVLILLTGVPGDPSSWLQGGQLVNTMNNFAGHHKGITPIVVIADQSGSFTNDTECLDSSQGNAGTYLTVDVPNYIKSHFRTSSDPTNWGIGGFSEGGMCAAMLTLTHQHTFRHFLDMSGDPNPFLNNYSQTLPVFFHNSKKEQEKHNIDWLLKHAELQPHLTAQFAIGRNDSKKLIREMRQSYYYSSKRNIITSFNIIANQGHSFSAWSQAYGDALPKLSFYLGATTCENSCRE
ncbi:MAG: alpha/beta hydrolase-fold protein [Candidatus Saccharimonadales bacterium]